MRTDNTTTLSAINKGTSSNQLAMQWLRQLFWLSATCNFRVTSRYIPTVANTLADAISCIHDPAHCEILVKKLISCPSNALPCVTPHPPRNAFDALPLQVQSMLKNNNFMPSGENTADRVSRSPQQPLTNHSYERIFGLAFTMVTDQCHALLIIYYTM